MVHGAYGAFVRDADGHSLEVVCHAPAGVVAKVKARVVAKKVVKKVTGKKRR